MFYLKIGYIGTLQYNLSSFKIYKTNQIDISFAQFSFRYPNKYVIFLHGMMKN